MLTEDTAEDTFSSVVLPLLFFTVFIPIIPLLEMFLLTVPAVDDFASGIPQLHALSWWWLVLGVPAIPFVLGSPPRRLFTYVSAWGLVVWVWIAVIIFDGSTQRACETWLQGCS